MWPNFSIKNPAPNNAPPSLPPVVLVRTSAVSNTPPIESFISSYISRCLARTFCPFSVNNEIDSKRRVCAVGTTVMRAIESSVSSDSHLNTFNGWTNKFIFPPYEFSIANCMITNFHTPKSTLMMMAAAFAGYDFLMEAYEEAVKEGYKFYSYGDAMLII